MDLGGKCLIAMPAMGDPRFERSVILICSHSPDGAMGIVVNKPLPNISFAELLKQINIPRDAAVRDVRVHFGGPVEPGRGFVLHSDDFQFAAATMKVPGGIAMTATLDVLEALARGSGPRQALLALGYSGWGEGQLEREILRNDWLICDPSKDLLFGSDDAGKWGAALGTLGVDPISLSAASGRA